MNLWKVKILVTICLNRIHPRDPPPNYVFCSRNFCYCWHRLLTVQNRPLGVDIHIDYFEKNWCFRHYKERVLLYFTVRNSNHVLNGKLASPTETLFLQKSQLELLHTNAVFQNLRWTKCYQQLLLWLIKLLTTSCHCAFCFCQ